MTWRTATIVVDLETGEIIGPKEREAYYIIEQLTKKETKVYGAGKQGLITYTKFGRRRPEQGGLFGELDSK